MRRWKEELGMPKDLVTQPGSKSSEFPQPWVLVGTPPLSFLLIESYIIIWKWSQTSSSLL